MAADSTLGYALLGLLHQRPRSGYDLRKIFVSTPMGVFSDSPGAIYPALTRLLRRRWIAGVVGPRNGRRRRLFAPTAAGRRAFAEWLGQPVTGAQVARDWDVVMLRLAFMSESGVPAARLARFLGELEGELGRYLAGLEGFLAKDAPKMPLSAQLAFESGVETYRAQARWLLRARARVGAPRRTR